LCWLIAVVNYLKNRKCQHVSKPLYRNQICYVIKRTDKLGSKKEIQQNNLINFFTNTFSTQPTNIWFAPQRFNQKSPAMAFVTFKEPLSFVSSSYEVIKGKSISIHLFNYDR
jgi:hypothetical protein